MRRISLALVTGALFAATAVPALAGGPPPIPAPVTPAADPTTQGTVVPPQDIVTVVVDAEHESPTGAEANLSLP